MNLTNQLNRQNLIEWQQKIKLQMGHLRQDIKKIYLNEKCSVQGKVLILQGFKQTLRVKLNKVSAQVQQLTLKNHQNQTLKNLVSKKPYIVISRSCLKQIDDIQMNALMRLQELIKKKNSIKTQKRRQLKQTLKENCKNSQNQNVIIPNIKMTSSFKMEGQPNIQMKINQRDFFIESVNHLHRISKINSSVFSKNNFHKINCSQIYKKQLCTLLKPILQELREKHSTNSYLIKTLKKGYKNQLQINIWLKEIILGNLLTEINKMKLLIGDQAQFQDILYLSNNKKESETTGSPNQKQNISELNKKLQIKGSLLRKKLITNQRPSQLSQNYNTKSHLFPNSQRSYLGKDFLDNKGGQKRRDQYESYKSSSQNYDSESVSISKILPSDIFSNKDSYKVGHYDDNQEDDLRLKKRSKCQVLDNSGFFDKIKDKSFQNGVFSKRQLNKSESQISIENQILMREDQRQDRLNDRSLSKAQNENQFQEQVKEQQSQKELQIQWNKFLQSFSKPTHNYQTHYQQANPKTIDSKSFKNTNSQSQNHHQNPFKINEKTTSNPFSSNLNKKTPNPFTNSQTQTNSFNPFKPINNNKVQILNPFEIKNNPFNKKVHNYVFDKKNYQTFQNNSFNIFDPIKKPNDSFNPFSSEVKINQQSNNIFFKGKNQEAKMSNPFKKVQY